jgi:hypothetical protein
LDLDAGDVATDEVTGIAVCAIRYMLEYGACDERLELGRRNPTNGSGTSMLPVQEG